MRKTATKHNLMAHACLGAIAVVLLLGGSMVVPTLSAYADHDKGNHKSQDDKKGHKKGKKGEHTDPPPQRCLHGESAKYNKHCTL